MGTSIYHKLRVLFILCFATGFSSSIVVQSLKQYIMKSYFEKYECLIDSNFQHFIAHQLPYALCEVVVPNAVRFSVLKRRLIGEGSHRHLSSSIGFHIKPEFPFHFCEVVIVERLPSGVFADPFELQHLHRRGVFGDIAVFGDTNLELPSFLSNRSAVEIHIDVVGSNVVLRDENELEINIELPLHARYLPLDDSGYSTVEFGDPDLFMRCNIEATLTNQVCLFTPTRDRAESKAGTIMWKIPSGKKAHSGVVFIVTFISAISTTLLIVLASLFCSDIDIRKDLKKS
ncbi:PIG-X domain-containing protein [Cephalotus follicularis]|uniref:PIG-X domain-containing protein n=1 Tax=Cephalotus follicularis TaxID=3775 RepID=A0A1Q3BID1_CEPFO|nr:PIG-X domain-containing protein [Cephalotus follicularis]